MTGSGALLLLKKGKADEELLTFCHAEKTTSHSDTYLDI